MAVGMCTRAVRLSFPPERVTCFELDKPVIFDVKEPILDTMLTLRERALCRRVVVPVDFERPPPRERPIRTLGGASGECWIRPRTP